MSERGSEPSPPASDSVDKPFAHPQDPSTQSQQSAESAASPAPPPAPALEPLFTLLTNATTGATIHPRVQYLFSDDDTSILSTPGDAPDHRTLVVDLAPTEHNTWSVQWASSLSPDFAITSSQLAVQRNDDANEGDASMMLRIEGVEREPLDASAASLPNSLPSSGSGAIAIGREDVDSLADEFKRRMGVLRKVVGESERRRELLDKQALAQGADAKESPGEGELAVQGATYDEEYPG